MTKIIISKAEFKAMVAFETKMEKESGIVSVFDETIGTFDEEGNWILEINPNFLISHYKMMTKKSKVIWNIFKACKAIGDMIKSMVPGLKSLITASKELSCGDLIVKPQDDKQKQQAVKKQADEVLAKLTARRKK